MLKHRVSIFIGRRRFIRDHTTDTAILTLVLIFYHLMVR
jgi:hypothetical protein